MRNTRGYVYMGSVEIPPFPQAIVIEDRADGTLWLLSHNTTEASIDDNGYIAINDTIPSNLNYRLYPKYEEPVMALDHNIRLIIRGGRLGMELFEQPSMITDMDGPRIMTRRSDRLVSNEIVKPSSWINIHSVLGWTPTEV